MTSLKNTLRTCVALSAVSIVSSCVPNMDLNNPEQLSVDTYYTTEAQLEASIIPAYEALIGQNQGGYARALYYNLLAPVMILIKHSSGLTCIRILTQLRLMKDC